jgi:2,3-dimethylmalate lyase
MGWLADRLKVEKQLVLNGCFDALSARMVEAAGAEATYCSGFSICAAAFGLPDTGLLTATEMLGHFQRIRAVTSLPMLVDADTGYGETQNVERTIVNLAGIGVTACHIEDQTFPKRCGHMEGKTVVDRFAATERMAAAVETGQRCGVDIIARTDALATHGLGEAIERANVFIAQGAVAAFVDAPRCDEDLRSIIREVTGPIVLNAAPIGKYRASTELMAAFQIILHPIELLLHSFSALDGHLGQQAINPDEAETAFDKIQHFLKRDRVEKYQESQA